MHKKYQVFVSSTYEDLIDERKEVTQALLENDCIPSGMELFPAASKSQWEFIKNIISDCDFYLLILAGRYGSSGIDDEGNRVSYTEMEFDYAYKIGKPIIVLVHDDIMSLTSSKVEKSLVGKNRLNRFIQKAKNGRLIKYWNNKDNLKSAVINGITNLKKTESVSGWIRADNPVDLHYIENNDDLAEIYANSILKKNGVNSKDVSILGDLASLHAKLKRIFILNNSTSIYLRNHNSVINIILYDDYILVKSLIMQVFVNPNNEPFTYKRIPILPIGRQLNTYRFINAEYNFENIMDKMNCYEEPRKSINPKYFYKTGLVFNFAQDIVEHSVKIETEYEINYADFFHSHYFKQYCKSVDIRINMSDQRRNNTGATYKLYWENFFSSVFDNHASTKKMLIQEPDHINFKEDDWVFPSDGYALSLITLSK